MALLFRADAVVRPKKVVDAADGFIDVVNDL